VFNLGRAFQFSWTASSERFLWGLEIEGRPVFFGDSIGIDFVNKIGYQSHWLLDETISSSWRMLFYVGDLLFRRARSGDRFNQPGSLFDGSWTRNSQGPDLFRAARARDANRELPGDGKGYESCLELLRLLW
jgi:hypothetical protein